MGIISKIKFGVVSFVVIGAVIWLGTPLLKFTKDRSRSDEVFTLDVAFEPKVRAEPVLISVFVNNIHLYTDGWKSSPWSAEHRGARTDVVKLSVTQPQDGKLTCTIMRGSDMAVFSRQTARRTQMCEVETK